MKPSSTRGSEGHVHRIFPLPLARRALDNGSSISLSGNMHPHLTSRNPPCNLGDRALHFHESGGQVSCLSISDNPKTINADPFSPCFRVLLIAISAVVMSSNSFPRFPKPDLSKLWCAHKIWPFNGLSLHQDFRLRDIVNPNARNSGLHPTKPWNRQQSLTFASIVHHLSTLLILWPTRSFCPFRTSRFVISWVPLKRLQDFNLRNPENRNSHVNPMTLVGLDLQFCLSWAWTFGNTRYNSPTPLWDLMAHRTSQILHR
jgi:hypothetical protein